MKSNNYSQEVEHLNNEALDFKYQESQIPMEIYWNDEKLRLDTRVRTFPEIDNTEDGWENKDRQQEYQASQQYNEQSQPC